MLEQFALGGVLSVVCGLDRTAFFQLMISRPVVAAPLTGWLLGAPETGLLVGALLELLWLGRLPMGAVIPPDDTQVAVGGTFLAIVFGEMTDDRLAITLMAVLLALPLGNVGAQFDHWARKANAKLSRLALASVSLGDDSRIERLHLLGLVHFTMASLGTFLVIACAGWGFMAFLKPYLLHPIQVMEYWIFAVFPLVGVSHVLSNMNVNRALSLFGSSFLMTYILLWLM